MSRGKGSNERMILTFLEANDGNAAPVGTIACFCATMWRRENSRALHESFRRAAHSLAAKGEVELYDAFAATEYHSNGREVRSSRRVILLVGLKGEEFKWMPEQIRTIGFGPDRDDEAGNEGTSDQGVKRRLSHATMPADLLRRSRGA